MKKIISSVLVLIFAVSSLQVCFAGYNSYGTGIRYTGMADQAQPPIIINTVSPNFDPKFTPNFNPNVNASSQGSKDYNGIANMIKWLVIIGGGTFLYFKYREPIETFFSGLAEPVQATLTSWLEVLQAKQNAEAIGWKAQGYQWLIQSAVSVTAFVLSLFPAVGKAGV